MIVSQFGGSTGYLTAFDGSYAFSGDVVQPNVGACCSGSLRCCSVPLWKESIFCSERVKIAKKHQGYNKGICPFLTLSEPGMDPDETVPECLQHL